MDKKIPKAVEVSVGIPTEGFSNNDDDAWDPSQRASTVQFKNIDSIVQDSYLVTKQTKYNYLLWSLIAIMTTIILVKIRRNT